MKIPAKVQTIIETLENAGFEAYAVGGCVRDTLLHRTPSDWDVTTNAHPEDVKKLFRRTVDTGILHGTVTVLFGNDSFEITTFRVDGVYKDSRHPESVTFTPDLKEDLMRRDFTVNAMAYNEKTGLIDYCGGQEDLERRIIRAVGDPLQRFTEDALRIMRCVRFSAQLDFTIEEGTYLAAKALSPALRIISVERIREELLKILLSDHPDRIALLQDIGALSGILPEYEAKAERINGVLKALPKKKNLRLAGLLAYTGEDLKQSYGIAERLLHYLKFDNDTLQDVRHLIRFHEVKLTTSEKQLRHFLNAYGKEQYEDLFLFMEKADGIDMEPVRTVCRAIIERGECTGLKEMAISGRDLIALGMRPGREMGELLMDLLSEVLDEPSLNSREILLEKAKAKIL